MSRGIYRTLLILGISCALNMNITAQTNTFPSSGNVGIGTTAPPIVPLEVNGTALIENGNALSLSSAINCGSGGVTCAYVKAAGSSSTSGYVDFQGYFAGVGFIAPIALNSLGGNVGIGSTAPWKMLSIGNGSGATFGMGGITGTSYNFDFDSTLGNYLQIRSEQPGATPFAITGVGNIGIGTTAPGAKLEVSGNVKLTSGSGASITFADGTTQSTAWNGALCGGDYAESVNVAGSHTDYEPGDVLVLSESDSSDVSKSSTPYSRLVAGIYSTRPGVLGRRQSGQKTEQEVPMAMVGIVPTKVSAENGPIRKGDLLVTSSTPGYAMKGTDPSRMLGTIVGKAMQSLDRSDGVIDVLVTLQ